MNSVWERWTKFAQKFGNVQARVLLTLIYATVILPFGISVRLFSDPLRIKHRPSRWLRYRGKARDWQWAKRQ